MDPDQIVSSVVSELRSIREEKGISVRDLAEKSGLSRAGIGHMENGETSPTLRFLLVVADTLDVELAPILAMKEKPTG